MQEKFTGTIRERQGLINLFDVISKGGTVVVESIPRLGRKTLDILSMIQKFEETGIQFVLLKENVDTRTPTGRGYATDDVCYRRTGKRRIRSD